MKQITLSDVIETTKITLFFPKFYQPVIINHVQETCTQNTEVSVRNGSTQGLWSKFRLCGPPKIPLQMFTVFIGQQPEQKLGTATTERN